MNPHPPTDSGPEGTCRHVGDTLARHERAGPNVPSADLDAVAKHLQTCEACRARHGARHSRLEGLRALRERSAPEGTFDDFFTQVRERVPFAPADGGMSRAFLDAPRTLRLWRSAAVAASLLLAATAGFAFTRGGGSVDPATAVRPLHDPREYLLEAYDTRPDARSIRAVRDEGRRGNDGFFVMEPGEVVPVGHGAGWR